MENGSEEPGWCERLHRAKAPELILYGRVLGLTHGEAEDVLHETFMALIRHKAAPDRANNYCIRAFLERSYL